MTSFGGAPTLQSATYNNSGIALSFVAPTLSAGLTITSYNYEISLDGGTTVSDSFSTTSYGSESYNNGPTSSPFIDPNGPGICPEGTSCSYAIQAVVADGTYTSAWSSWVSVTSFGGAPTLQSATYNNSGIALSFVAPTLSAGLTITSYNYEISLDGGTTVSDSFSTTSYGSESYNNGPTSRSLHRPQRPRHLPGGHVVLLRDPGGGRRRNIHVRLVLLGLGHPGDRLDPVDLEPARRRRGGRQLHRGRVDHR